MLSFWNKCTFSKHVLIIASWVVRTIWPKYSPDRKTPYSNKTYHNGKYEIKASSLTRDNKWSGGALNFFSGRGVQHRFPSVGLRTDICLWKGGLWAENFQIWGLVSWKFPNLGACELKISKFGGLWAKIWVKIEAIEAKISKFSQKGVLWTDTFAWNGTLANFRRGMKRGSSRPHIPIPPF